MRENVATVEVLMEKAEKLDELTGSLLGRAETLAQLKQALYSLKEEGEDAEDNKMDAFFWKLNQGQFKMLVELMLYLSKDISEEVGMLENLSEAIFRKVKELENEKCPC